MSGFKSCGRAAQNQPVARNPQIRCQGRCRATCFAVDQDRQRQFFCREQVGRRSCRRQIIAVREPQVQNRADDFIGGRQSRLRRLDFHPQAIGHTADAQIRHVVFQNDHPGQRGIGWIRAQRTGQRWKKSSKDSKIVVSCCVQIARQNAESKAASAGWSSSFSLFGEHAEA